MTEKNMTKADFYTSVVLMAFGITVIVMALDMPIIARDPYSSPGVLPVILGIVITALSFIMFVRSLWRTKGHLSLSGSFLKDVISSTSVHRILATIIICFCYAFLLGKLVFPLLTFLFIFAFIVFFEYDRKTPFKAQRKNLFIAALTALLTSASVTVVFRYLFLVRLP